MAKSVFLSNYPSQKQLKTLGDHIRKRRLDLKLEQDDLAKMFNANRGTIANWEQNRFEPAIEFMPKIFEFLEYIPKDLFRAETLPEKILFYRQIHGLTQKELAKQVGVDPCSIMDWENGKFKPSKKKMIQLLEMLIA